MLEIANLLFHTAKSNKNAFSKNTKSIRNVDVSDYSFQKTLNSCQKKQISTQDKIEENIDDTPNNKKKLISKKASDNEYKFKENKVEEEQSTKNEAVDEDIINSIGIFPDESKIFLTEMLASLLSNSSNIIEDNFFENLKRIASSIQKIIGDKPMLPANIINDIQAALKSLLSKDIDMLDESYLLNNIKMMLESFSYEDVADGTVKQNISTGSLEDNQSSNIMSDIAILDKKIPYSSYYDSSANMLPSNDVLLQIAKPGPKEFMSMLKTAGLGKMALISSADTETDSATEVVDTEILEHVVEQDVEREIVEGILHSEKDNLLNYNLEENQAEEMLSNTELPMDFLLAESFKTNSSADILDITKALSKDSPAASIEIIRDLAEKISIKLNANYHEIELQIKPESLGRLVLKVTLEDGVLSGRIFTDNKQTAEILQRNLDDLKNALEQQGYKFSHLDVDVGNEREPGQFQQHWENPINFRRNKQSMQLLYDVDMNMEEKIQPSSNRISLNKIDYFA